MPAKRNGWPPRWLTRTTPAERKRGDGAQAADFLNGLCRITKDTVAGSVGEPLVLRPWQSELLAALLARRAEGRYRHRQALVGMPRKNGKSALGSGLALYGLLFGPEGGEVYSCAAEKEQAKIVFGMARRMVELEPELGEHITLYRDVMEVKSTGSIYRVLSAEAYSKEGLNPTLVLFDEVHAQPNRELWDVMALAMGARVEPLMVGITTAGVMTDNTGNDSLCFELYKHGQQVAQGLLEDPSFFFAWWEPVKGIEADHRDPKVWREANPGFDDIVSAEDFVATITRTPENEYRTKRTNVFTQDAIAWLPFGAWVELLDARSIPDGTDVVLGFDGSFNNDSTALVVASCGEKPHLDVVAVWEKSTDDTWRVPILDVEEEIRKACRKFQVREIVCDPFRWARTYQALEAEGLPVMEYPQSPQRMVPATQRFYEAALNKGMTHSGNPDLARHVANVIVKTDARGSRLDKTKGRKIDLAIAAVMAFDRAATSVPETPKPFVVFA